MIVVRPVVLLLRTLSPSPLPMPTLYAGPLRPPAMSPKERALYSLVAGVNHRVAAFGSRGGSLFERRIRIIDEPHSSQEEIGFGIVIVGAGMGEVAVAL